MAKAKKSSGSSAPAAQATTGFSGMHPAEKVMWVCLHLAIFLVPLAMSNLTALTPGRPPVTYDQFDIVKVVTMRAFALIALGAWAWRLFTSGGRVRRTPADLFILVFLGWVVLTTFTSISPATAVFGKYRRFEGLLSFFTYALLYFLVVQVADRPSRIRSIARTLFFSAVGVSFYGVLQAIGADPFQWGALPFEARRSFSTFGNPDLLGGFMMFPMPIAIGLALSEKNTWWRIAYWGGFLMFAVVWITEAVRGAWVGFAVAFVVLVFGLIWTRTKVETTDYAFAGGAAGVVALLVALSTRSENEVLNVVARVKSIFQFGEGSAKTRFEIWQAAVDAVKDRPLIGYGADTFRLVFPKYKPYEYVADAGYLSVADNVHNYPLQIASALGLPGFLLLYGLTGLTATVLGLSVSPIAGPTFGSLGVVGPLVVTVVFAAGIAGLVLLKGRERARTLLACLVFGVFGYVLYLAAPQAFKRGSGAERMLYLSIWAACFGYITHLFFGLSVTGSTFLLWICFALLLSPTARAVEFAAPAWGRIAAATTVGIVALLSVGNVVNLVADHYYLVARVNENNPPVRIPAAETAVQLNPYNDIYRAEVGMAYQSYMVALQSSIQSGQNDQNLVKTRDEAFRFAEQALKETIEFVPTEYDNYVFISNLYNQYASITNDRQYFQQAADWAEKGMTEVEPHGPAVRVQLSVAYAALGREDDALKLLEETVKMDPAYIQPKELLGRLYLQKGATEKASAVFKDIAERDPSNTMAQSALQSLTASPTTGAQ